MKMNYTWLGRIAAAGLVGVLSAASGVARADTYNIIFKDAGGTIISCATAGFTFTKTTAGSFPATSPVATLTGCPVPLPSGTFTPALGVLNVVVEDVVKTETGEEQGPNVVGLSGTLQASVTDGFGCDGTTASSGTKTYVITYAYASTAPTPNPPGRTYSLTCVDSNAPSTVVPLASGYLYHVYNTSAPVPEPETLWLALLGLGALALSRRRRRRT